MQSSPTASASASVPPPDLVAEVKGASKVYQVGDQIITALQPTHLQLRAGELLLIVGPSGSGKTTLLSLLGCVIYPTAGEVIVDGVNVTHLNDKALARLRLRSIGFVFQSFNLIQPLTAEENVLLPLQLLGVPPQQAKSRVADALALVGMSDRRFNLPKQLSGGQQQRVAIARALVTNPRLMLCDEPTASLDVKSVDVVMRELKTLAQRGKALAVVTHDLRLRQYADRMVYVNNGMVSFTPHQMAIFTKANFSFISMNPSKLLLPCLWVGILSGCGQKPTESQKATDAASARPAATAPTQADQAVALGRIEPELKFVTLAAEAKGVIEQVAVAEGAQVKKGALIVALSHTVEQAKVRQLQARLATQQSQILAERAALESLKLKVANNQKTYQRTERLANQGGDTPQNLDNARTDFESGQQDLARQQALVNAAQARLAEMATDVAEAQAELERRFVRAPVDGQILQLTAVAGASATEGSALGEFAPNGPISALLEVDELYATSIQLGQKGYVREQGRRDTLSVGEVVYASPQLKKKSLFSGLAGDPEDRRVREVRLRLKPSAKLLFGARVEGVVQLGTAPKISQL